MKAFTQENFGFGASTITLSMSGTSDATGMR